MLYNMRGCRPDCPDRKPGCQTEACPEYAKMRAKIEAVKAGRLAERNTMTKRSEVKTYLATNQLKRYR